MDQKPIQIIRKKKIIVAGGGLAGLSAAHSLTSHGYNVTLIEKRPFLGGRTFSFKPGNYNVEIDNGQHIFLGCCDYYIQYLQSIGNVENTYIQKKLKIDVIRNGEKSTLSSTPFLGNLHMLPAFIRYPHLGIIDKFLVIYGLIRCKFTKLTKISTSLDKESAYTWLKRNHQSDKAIDNFWNLFILPALNNDAKNVSADMVIMGFQESLLKQSRNSAIGIPKIGLTALNGNPVKKFIEDNGGQVILGQSIKNFKIHNGKVSHVELSSGKRIDADAYLSAIPAKHLLKILPGKYANDKFFSRASSLTTSPIVGIHIWYDRIIMPQDFVAILDSPIQWIFNKNVIQSNVNNTTQHICISLSGASQWIDTPKNDLKKLFTGEISRIFPKAKNAKIEKIIIVKEYEATYQPVPGYKNHRLPTITPVKNFFLAGDWTDTGWPSTMEGAVRSGYTAADVISQQI